MPGKNKNEERSRECSCARLVEEQAGKATIAGDSDALYRIALTELERDTFLKALLGALREIDELDESEEVRDAQCPPER